MRAPPSLAAARDERPEAAALGQGYWYPCFGNSVRNHSRALVDLAQVGGVGAWHQVLDVVLGEVAGDDVVLGDVDAEGVVAVGFLVERLSFRAEHPVEEELGGVRVRGLVHDEDVVAAGADGRAFLQRVRELVWTGKPGS